MSNTKDIRQLIHILRRQGWTAEQRKSGHWRLTNPAGEWMTCSYSPRSGMSVGKIRSDVRRLGGDV